MLGELPTVDLHQTAIDRGNTEFAAHRRCPGKFTLDQFEDILNAFGAVGSQSPQRRPAEQNGPRAERQCLEYVAAAAEAAVNQDGNFTADCICDSWKYLYR